MFNKEKITSLKKLTLTLSGMRVTEEYEIIGANGRAELSLYTIIYSHGKDERRLEKRAETDIDEIISILNECRVYKWDGFNGKNPPHVLDGTMFTLKAEINNDEKIYAHGSNNYPKNYREFMNHLYELLNK